MSTVTGSFSIQLNGVESSVKFAGLDYRAWALAQVLVVDALGEAATWGLAGALGQPPVGPDPGLSTGDVSYRYIADFADGGHSSGENAWNGIPEGAAARIHEALTLAAGYLAP